MNTLLISIALLIIAILAVIAAYYVIKLKRAQKQQKEAIAANHLAWQKHRQELISDLRFIANAMVQQQCEITEGCMRLVVLMDRLDETLQHKSEFRAIQQHFNMTAHMPIHDAYKALSKKEQFKLDRQRYDLEEKHKEQVISEANVLLTYPLDKNTLN